MVTHSQVSNTQKDHKVKVSSGYIVNLCLQINKQNTTRANQQQEKENCTTWNVFTYGCHMQNRVSQSLLRKHTLEGYMKRKVEG